jgi:LPS-assembly protein
MLYFIKDKIISLLVLTLVICFGMSVAGVCSAAAGSVSDRLFGNDEAPWEITAKRLTYNADEQLYEAEGDVVIKKQGRLLYAKKARYNEKTGVAEVDGEVWFETQGDILVGDKGVFDLNRQTGTIKKGCLFLKENNYYISGETMEKLSKNRYLIEKCSLSTCDGSPPAWSINSSKVEVTIEGYGTAKHATFRVRRIPAFYVPYLVFPAKTKRQTGLLPPMFGTSGRNGFEIEVPFFWAISDQTDATFYQHYMSDRGYMQGLEFRYLGDENSRGAFLFDILSDREDEKDMTDKDDVEYSPFSRTNQTRYWLRGRTDQDLPFNMLARLDIDFVSDQDYLREFDTGLFGMDARPELDDEFGRPVEDKRSATRRTALRLSRDREIYSLQAMASYNQRPEHISDDETPQSLANLYFNRLPEQLQDTPVFYRFESDYGYVWRDSGSKGHRMSLSPEITLPFWLGPYLEFEPWLGYTYSAQWYDEDGGGNDHAFERAYATGARLATRIERLYDVEWGNAKRLKHRIWPTLNYIYREHHDEDADTPWFEPVDDEGDLNLITFALENFLDARLEDQAGNVSYRQWGKFTLTQGYDIIEARGHKGPDDEKEPWTPLTASFTVTPYNNIDIYGNAGWDYYDHEFSSATLSADFTVARYGGKEDTYQFDYVYSKDDQKFIDFWVDINLVYGFSIGSSIEKDFEADESISNSLWMRYQSQCWGILFMAEKEDEETSVNLSFQLKGLGEFDKKP